MTICQLVGHLTSCLGSVRYSPTSLLTAGLSLDLALGMGSASASFCSPSISNANSPTHAKVPGGLRQHHPGPGRRGLPRTAQDKTPRASINTTSAATVATTAPIAIATILSLSPKGEMLELCCDGNSYTTYRICTGNAGSTEKDRQRLKNLLSHSNSYSGRHG